MDGETSPEPLVFESGRSLPARIRSLPALRVAALWEAFMVAAASLRQNKLRTALTLVGIIVGVTAVIAVVTIIKGLDQTVAQTFSSQGSTVFTISKDSTRGTTVTRPDRYSFVGETVTRATLRSFQ